MSLRRPFAHLRSEEWLRLAAFALVVFYAILAVWAVLHLGLFSVLGGDFRAFFAAARIAATSGFDQVYNLAVQKAVQKALMASYTAGEVETIPVPFLPPFILPFIIFLPLGLSGGFALWTTLNIIILAVYLSRFVWKSKESSLLMLALLSFPIFLNFFFGQVSVWLLICIGEFLRAWEQGRPFHSGLWLGGLLLKPQILILLLPFLAVSREWGILTGFAVALTAVGAVSLALAGPEGLRAWAILLFRYTGNLPTINPEVMINLRMVGEVLSVLLASEAVRSIVAGLSVVVAMLALALSLRWRRRTPEERSGMLLFLLAATSLVTWHSHIHMAAILIPPFLRQVSTRQMPPHLFVLWTMLPPAIYFLGIASMALLSIWGRPFPPLPGLTYPALALLIFHIYFAVRVLCRLLSQTT
jgi:hypothetical protein